MSTNETDRTPPRQGISQLMTRRAIRTLLRRPRWFLQNIRQGPHVLWDKRKQTGVAPFAHYVESESTAISSVLGIDSEEYERVLAQLWIPHADHAEPFSVWNAREELLRIIGAIVKVRRPRVVVETGVALGFTTATVLRAMETNGEGHLYSIDLPALQYDPDYPVGRAVPRELKPRWTLRLGDSRRHLDPLAAEVAPIDLSIHDALHTFTAQLREYRTIWPHLRPGGLLVSDDVGNAAFVEFANEVGSEPHLVLGPSRSSAIGLLRKSQ